MSLFSPTSAEEWVAVAVLAVVFYALGGTIVSALVTCPLALVDGVRSYRQQKQRVTPQPHQAPPSPPPLLLLLNLLFPFQFGTTTMLDIKPIDSTSPLNLSTKGQAFNSGALSQGELFLQLRLYLSHRFIYC